MLLQCVVYSISQGIIIDHNYIFETDNLPIQGLDPDLRVYGYYTEFPEPPYDSRGFTLVTTKTMIDSAHPVYPDLLTYSITYSTDRKSDELLQIAVDNEEQNANELLLPAIQSCSKRQRALKLLNKRAKGFSLSDEEDEYLDAMDDIADAMDDNADNANQMYDYIEANPILVPDFDEGWTTSI